ncbi:(2Fe-2S)-binding protein [Bordetella genomosp. 11]|uniref:4-hydroxybenzoyl-CoA reductase subunit gamma n=1 Tax=Bordetella genomosp. 11 TaxID=1416808 RepID=A0A261UFU1_9BORD|nr:(2Fe-2S)-binding protein [Bordetella genomosp. 11]OZI60397.1 4-hydroxybenzoyl-CoA reductase subunit gamma [Bordetella genomosp. 11]
MNPDDTSRETRPIRLVVNGEARCGTAEPRVHLADFLRGELKLTGTHIGCEHGVCGACTVLVDGQSARSCLMLAVQAEGCGIETIEGLAASDGTPHPLQAAFHELHALQCGYCTPGILMSLVELLRDRPDPDEALVRDVLSGHLCRCTGYQNIVAAALRAAQRLREGRIDGSVA